MDPYKRRRVVLPMPWITGMDLFSVTAKLSNKFHRLSLRFSPPRDPRYLNKPSDLRLWMTAGAGLSVNDFLSPNRPLLICLIKSLFSVLVFVPVSVSLFGPGFASTSIQIQRFMQIVRSLDATTSRPCFDHTAIVWRIKHRLERGCQWG